MTVSIPQYLTKAITGPLPDPPGVKLQKEGLKAKHPIVFVPGMVTDGLELSGRGDNLFRKRLWGGTVGEVYKRPLCWVVHMSLDNETGLDPSRVRVQPVIGLVAADNFALAILSGQFRLLIWLTLGTRRNSCTWQHMIGGSHFRTLRCGFDLAVLLPKDIFSSLGIIFAIFFGSLCNISSFLGILLVSLATTCFSIKLS